MEIVLIPGVNIASVRKLFDMIKEAMPDRKFVELPKASEEELDDVLKDVKGKFTLIGKSMGGRIALDYQLKHKNASALVLFAPYLEADKKFEAVNVPTLIIHGTKDTVISADNSKKLNSFIKSSELVIIEGADHSCMGKEAESVNAVKDFLKQKGI